MSDSCGACSSQSDNNRKQTHLQSRFSFTLRLEFVSRGPRRRVGGAVSAIVVGSMTLVCTFGCALLGMVIRRTLPPSHLERESQDVVRLGMGLVATMTALLLGLVTAAAKGSFDAQDNAIRNSAANILALDRLLARYGPETAKARDLLKEAVAYRVESTWPTSRTSRSARGGFQSGRSGEPIEEEILALAPATDAQRWFKSQALGLTQEVLKTRWRLLSSAEGSVPSAFLIVVIFWLAATFTSFGLFSPRNGTVMVVFFIAALSVAAAVFLILELNQPFEGLIKISGGPMRYALEHLGK